MQGKPDRQYGSSLYPLFQLLSNLKRFLNETLFSERSVTTVGRWMVSWDGKLVPGRTLSLCPSCVDG